MDLKRKRIEEKVEEQPDMEPPKIPKLVLPALLCALSPEQLPECFINIECLPLSTDVDTHIYKHCTHLTDNSAFYHLSWTF